MSAKTASRPARRASLVLGVLALGTSALSSPARASLVVDGINREASPTFANNTYVRWGVKDAGWYYTPSFSYNLDGVYTDFLGIGDSLGIGSTVKTVTARVMTDRPVNGGAVLGEGSFDVRLGTGGHLGGTFAPVRLAAGTAYFVALLNVEDVGNNLGTWVADAGGNPRPAGGATVNLGGYYFNTGAQTNFASAGGPYGQAAGLNLAGGEPILFFTGTPVPEPSAAVAAAIGALGLLARRRRRR
jgi:hypothetical protein